MILQRMSVPLMYVTKIGFFYKWYLIRFGQLISLTINLSYDKLTDKLTNFNRNS